MYKQDCLHAHARSNCFQCTPPSEIKWLLPSFFRWSNCFIYVSDSGANLSKSAKKNKKKHLKKNKPAEDNSKQDSASSTEEIRVILKEQLEIAKTNKVNKLFLRCSFGNQDNTYRDV